jgi:5-methylcytosine-specific restriction endonuclease McrA
MAYKKIIKIPWNKGLIGIQFCSEETKQKMSRAAKGKSKSEEHKNNIKKNHADFSGENHPQYCKYAHNNIPKYNLYVSRLEPYEQCQQNEQDPNILEVKCTYCGKWFIPTILQIKHRIRGINNNDRNRFYCSSECKQECPIYRRSKYYKGQHGESSREVQPELRQLVFLRDNWTCQKCGVTEHLHCHHIDPVKLNPVESADVDNCITFCKDCHKHVHMCIPGCGYTELRNCNGISNFI